jgi:hypothetical protein
MQSHGSIARFLFLLVVTFCGQVTTASAFEDEDSEERSRSTRNNDDGDSLLDDVNRDVSVGCAALDTFGSIKSEASGGPELNWAAWGCWVGGVAGLMCTPAGAAVGAPLGAAFGMVVGSVVDSTDVAFASLWAVPAILLGVVMTVAGTAAAAGILYAQGFLVTANPLQENAFIIGATAASIVIMGGAFVTGPLAMAGLAHGLHGRDDGTNVAVARPEQGLRLTLEDDSMRE